MIERREFLKSLASLSAATVALPAAEESDRLGKLLPKRTLGRTGVAVTMLGVGGWHIGRMEEPEAQRTIETALEGGIRFFDNAESYQDGASESRYGRLLTPKYRDVVFLMTKSTATDAATARRHLEESLLRMKTDYVDLWQMHSVTSVEDVDQRIQNGILDVMLEAKKSGKARHIGYTGHHRPAAHQRVLEKTDIFETCQMPVNLADPGYESFIKNVLPKLVDRKIGVIAMKTLANGGFFGGSRQGEHGDNPKVVPDRVSIQQAIHFVWSLPVSVLVTGSDNADHMKEKIGLARSFAGVDEGERTALIQRVAGLAGKRVEFYKA